jgi:putative Holliday junction resolvase
MRVLGIDYGDKRTGIAISDPMGWTAQGLEAVIGGMAKAAERVSQLAKQYDVKTLVVGYPINMDGSTGFRAVRTDEFISALKKRLNDGDINFIKWDERLTSTEASRKLKAAGVKPTARGVREKGKIDILSAAILLQSYLDSGLTHNGNQPGGELYERR